jgi:hypothetical protein
MDVMTSPRPAERRNAASRRQLLLRIESEFFEMPCLRLTGRQAQRLFALRPDVCERVLAALVADGTLARGADARYGLRADVAWRHRISRFREPAQRPA